MLKVPVSSEDHIEGDEKARMTLVEYGDYQCPYCGMAYPIIKELQNFFGKRLKFVFRNFPLVEIHPNAKNAAMAAEFAAVYNKFWEMHDLLYEHQQALEIPNLLSYAESLGLPPKDLQFVIENDTFASKIKNDFMGGVRSAVNGTPTFFINGNRHNGSFEYEVLLSALQKFEK